MRRTIKALKHVTARLVVQKVDVKVGEECRTVQALKEAIVVALPKLCVEGFDVSVGGRALDDEGVVSLDGDVPLDVSANPRGLSVLALREAGHEVGEAGLITAACAGDVALCTLYLDAGVPIDCTRPTDWYSCYTSLHCACDQGHLEIVTLLLDRGAAIDRESRRGETPLFISCRSGRLEIARLLLDRGSTAMDVKTINHYKPLGTSYRNGNSEITRLLLDRGCPVDVEEYKAGDCHRDFLELLSEYGHDVLPDAPPPCAKRRRRTKQSDQ